MAEASDVELLARWRDGDLRAGDTLAARYFLLIRGYFVNKAPADHEDLVQETFARLSSKRDRYRGESSFRVFLFGVARMILLEHLRAKQRDQRIDPMEHSVADLEGGRMSSLLAQREAHRMLLDALRELPLADQELLELYYWQKLTAREIGELHSASEPTIRSRLRAAIKRLTTAYMEIATHPHEREIEGEIESWLTELRGEISGLQVTVRVA
jgi:RNA polymerase sigma-70 factor (ECF subfamily)